MKNKCTTTRVLIFNTYTCASDYCFKHALRQVRCTWCSLYSFLVSLDNNSLHSHSGCCVLFWLIHFLLNTKIWFTCRVPKSGGKILQWLGLHLDDWYVLWFKILNYILNPIICEKFSAYCAAASYQGKYILTVKWSL